MVTDQQFSLANAALRYPLIGPPRTCVRSIRAVISTAKPG
jgi:hypothetical protein